MKVCRIRWAVLVAASLVAALASAVTLGQVDDFQDGTLMFWGGGAALTNVANGGPNGAGDRFLQIQSNGGSGPGSRLATLNTNQWSGDYIAAGVQAVEMHLNNFSAQDLHMRIVVFGPGLATQWTSAQAVVLPAGSGWRRVTFLLTQSALTRVSGTDSYTTCLSNASQLMIRHNVNASSGGDPIAATMGMDNVTAVVGPTLLPNVFQILTGVPQSGNVQSLWFQDTDRLVVREAPPIALGLPSVDIRIDGTSLLTTVSGMSLRVVTSTSAVPAAATTQVVQMRNFSASIWETVDTRAGTGSDNAIVITPTGDPNRFIQSGTRLVQVRIRWFDPGTLFTFGWVGRINQVNWLTTP